ncbi:TonB-dependent receptor plug domain-containing protein [Adhaeribacter aquaticus]|uniref:TonB-dependent receptor plug domain-containing protein n=1 Tax=Adhaeribacter aquaticus TaxID=299567 RepID=UPI0003FFC9C5|nr:TonB-dependent receptor plug domain-containing protein [Adhaeribacter aquaticus]
MNKNKIKQFRYILPVLLLAILAFANPPANLLKEIKANLETFRNQYSPEKVYLQLDKPYYAPGQSIWMKGYVVDATNLRPSTKSGVLYVDLMNGKNQAVERLTLKAENGKAKGDVQLPMDLPAGEYRLVAYTQWMRNLGEESFFNKEIKIVGANDEKAIAALASGAIDLQFFPEGGDLVAGLKSQVAFKATAANGAGVPVAGAVFDEQGNKQADFSDAHLGMGAFTLQPQVGKRYIAKVKTKEGKTTTYPLPAAKPSGYVLSLNETPDARTLAITIAANTTNSEPLVLTGISRDAIVYAENINIKSGEVLRKNIDTEKFPGGIIRFNLARATGEPLAERLAFVYNQEDLTVTLTADKTAYNNREKVTMLVAANDRRGNPVSADLSLAVIDADLVKYGKNSQNIKSYLLLTSDLKGYVEQPGYYFEKSSQERRTALNYLLMTQGWRRFGWKEIANGAFPVLKFPNEEGLSIKGKLVTNKGKAVEGGEALLYLQGQTTSFITTETDKQGQFAFNGFDFTGNVDMVVQGTDARGRRHNLLVKMDDNNFVPQASGFNEPWYNNLLANIDNNFIKASNHQLASVAEANTNYTLRSILLPNVEIKGEKDMYVPFTLHQKADVVLNRRELAIAPSGNILESLQGRVAGLQVFRTGQNQFRASIRGQQNSPLYLLDGMPISESTLNSLNQFDISRIEILKNMSSAAIYGGRASGGVIALFTQRTNEDQGEVKPGTYIIVHNARGYSKVREFYSPQYEGQAPAGNEPDLRSTIYWNPSVKTDAQGKATVTFYTADRTTRYQAIAEGISDDGKPGSGEATFAVTNKKRNL